MSETKLQPELSEKLIAALRLLTSDPQFPWNLGVDITALRLLESHGLAQRSQTGMSFSITDQGVRYLEALDHGLASQEETTEPTAEDREWLEWITAVYYRPRVETGESHLRREPLATTFRSAAGHDTTPTILEIISPSSGTIRFSKTPDGRVRATARTGCLVIRPMSGSTVSLRDPADSELGVVGAPEPLARIIQREDHSLLRKIDTRRLLHIELRSRGGLLKVFSALESHITRITADGILEITPSTATHAVTLDNQPLTELW